MDPNENGSMTRVRWLGQRFSTGTLSRPVLALTVGMFIAVRMADSRASSELVEHLESISADGGGVLLVSQPRDCIEFSTISGRIAESLEDHQVPVRGLIIGGRVSAATLEEAMRIANSRFPHSVVGRRTAAVALRATGFDTTPVALVVDSAGRITAIEQITRDPRVIERLAMLTGASG